MADHYRPEGFALKIFKDRYALHEHETWEEACERVGHYVATAEKGEDLPKYKNIFYDLLKSNYFMPAGRIWYGSGRPDGNLLNCFVIPIRDSIEGWGANINHIVITSGRGGGCGTNFSPVRPRGSAIGGHRGLATGAVSPMRGVNAYGNEIKGGGGRRVALMFCLGLNHGDILEFLDEKLDNGKLNNANVSVVFDDNPEQLFEKVKKNEQLELKFQGRTVGTVSAVDLWKKIVSNALKGGEPGLLNGYLANKMSNIYYWRPLISTNPCGEIWLSEFDCCCLGAMVLPRFVVNDDLDWNGLERDVAIAVRFLDNVLTVNAYPLPQIADTCSNIRRIGLGVMGLHDMLLMLGLKYNSDKGIEFVNKVMKFIKEVAYEASIALAAEKGPFPAFDAEKFLKSGFVKTLKPSIRTKIKENGIRNCALLTIAPTGTTSMVCAVTSGIEPMFAPAYERRYYEGDKLAKEVVIHPLFRSFVEAKKSVKHFQGAHDLDMRDHFEMQRVCQAHLDNACSKTINIPKGTSEEYLSELYMEYFPELKGVTVYPDGSRADQPLTPIPLDEAVKHVKTATESSFTQDSCKGGSCDI